MCTRAVEHRTRMRRALVISDVHLLSLCDDVCCDENICALHSRAHRVKHFQSKIVKIVSQNFSLPNVQLSRIRRRLPSAIRTTHTTLIDIDAVQLHILCQQTLMHGFMDCSWIRGMAPTKSEMTALDIIIRFCTFVRSVPNDANTSHNILVD